MDLNSLFWSHVGINQIILEGTSVKLVVIATLALASLAAVTRAQAEIICTNRGCWETGKKIFRNGGAYRGLPYVNHRDSAPDSSFYPKPKPHVRITREW
jgi:hypothetical protein